MLLGEERLNLLASSSVAVVGLGGVGGMAAEMIARAGVGRILLLDADVVSPSNRNRQIIAFESTTGKAKAQLVAARLKDINPEAELQVAEVFLTEGNVESVITPFAPDFVIDAIDTLAPKLALISFCCKNGIPLVSSMGAGAKYDMTKVRITDVSKTFNCPLAYVVRKKLRKMGISKGFKAVFSEELPDGGAIVEMDAAEQAAVPHKKSQAGTISYLPAAFGCACAQAAILHLISA